MNRRDIESITGIGSQALGAVAEFHVFAELGEGVESLGAAGSIEGALAAIRERAFRLGPPEIGPEMFEGRVEDPEFGPLAYALSDDCLMDRICDERELVYLKSVVVERPELRLLVAWEAAPPHQDAAFGIFVPREGRG